MKESLWKKYPACIYLLLHTVIITLLACIGTYSYVLTGNLPVSVISVAAAITLTIYTANRIIQSLRENFAKQKASLAQFSTGLQTMSAHLNKYATELDYRAKLIERQQKEIEQRVGLLHDYRCQMMELVSVIDAYTSDAQIGDDGSHVKTSWGLNEYKVG